MFAQAYLTKELWILATEAMESKPNDEQWGEIMEQDLHTGFKEPLMVDLNKSNSSISNGTTITYFPHHWTS